MAATKIIVACPVEGCPEEIKVKLVLVVDKMPTDSSRWNGSVVPDPEPIRLHLIEHAEGN
jgi:hypothetical protein